MRVQKPDLAKALSDYMKSAKWPAGRRAQAMSALQRYLKAWRSVPTNFKQATGDK